MSFPSLHPHQIDFPISRQPNDTTCGPACLHSVYRYYRDHIALEDVIGQVKQLDNGGTLAVWLACHALRRGYRAHVYTYNLEVFDPTWFGNTEHTIQERLRTQLSVKRKTKLQIAIRAYLEFLELGGTLELEDLTTGLLRRYLNRNQPILTGLSATWLYRCAREIGNPSRYDDIVGVPVGHFVVLCGYDKEERSVLVADPLLPNPLSGGQHYMVKIERLVGAILLGILTYDANLLILSPKHNPSKDSLHVGADRR